jgi:hypothetical protein
MGIYFVDFEKRKKGLRIMRADGLENLRLGTCCRGHNLLRMTWLRLELLIGSAPPSEIAHFSRYALVVSNEYES